MASSCAIVRLRYCWSGRCTPSIVNQLAVPKRIQMAEFQISKFGATITAAIVDRTSRSDLDDRAF
jgi:hypothetical protein